MNQALRTIAMFTGCIAPTQAMALDKVVVIPLDSCSQPKIEVPVVESAGRTWMALNLGAYQVATSSTDAAAYGALYQWGRFGDGHQYRSSATTTTLSSSDTPGHNQFILALSSPYDWRSPQNANLWQGASSSTNPCPAGFRVPTATEWETERISWSSNNAAGAFASPLKLVVAGYRFSDGTLHSTSSYGCYWSSTVAGSKSLYLYFLSAGAYTYDYYRSSGLSVRCIKD